MAGTRVFDVIKECPVCFIICKEKTFVLERTTGNKLRWRCKRPICNHIEIVKEKNDNKTN